MSNYNNNQTQNLEVENISDYYRAIVKRKWLVLIILVSVVFIMALYTMRQQKVYEAVNTIEIDLRADNVLSNVNDVYQLGDMHYWDNKTYYKTQYKILQSRAVAKMVVDRLHLDKDLVFLGLDKIEDQTELAEKLEKANPIEILGRNLRIAPIQESRLVKVYYRGTDPKMITTIANTVVQAYIEQNLDRKLSSTKNALAWLTEQVQELKDKLEESETKLYEFKKENDILSTDMEEKANIVGTRLDEVSREVSREESVLIKKKALFDSMSKYLGDSIDLASVATTTELRTPLIKDLKVTYNRLQNEFSELHGKYKEKHPDVVLVKSKLDRTKKNLHSEIKGIIEGSKAEYLASRQTVKDLHGMLEDIKSQARELTTKQVQYNRLLREKESNQRVFEQVLLRLKEIDLSGMLKNNNIRLLDVAIEPVKPISPRVHFNLLVGILLGLMLSFGTAIVLEFMDKSLKSADDIERYLKLPLLGIIPEVKIDPKSPEASIKNAPDTYTYLKPKSSMAECVRTIRTNISFSSPENPLDRMLITSALPKEGKTTIVSNLSIAMATSGKRILVIDTDMRRPRLHKAFAMNNEYGLSNVIMGTMEIDEAVRSTGIENLNILTCGPIPPNPSEIIGSGKFRSIIDKLDERYDKIVFDSPPVIAVTDAMILSNIVDGVVLVVKCGKTPRDVAIQAKKQLMDVNANILGSVINDLDLDNKEYGNYYYYYYHRYGYYYGEKETTSEAMSG